MNKPPFRIPAMAEIEAIPWNGFNVVSTFSGAGGSCLGYRMAGFRVLWASEFVPAAREVYKLNHPDSILDARDIREVQAQDILNVVDLQRGELDLLDGSPPCASFSTSGRISKGWGKVKVYSETKQRVDDLFFEYARLIDGLRPKVFVAENVSGLVKGKSKGYFKHILRTLHDCGYEVKARLLNAQWLGVPQSRERLIFVGVRQDLGLQPVFPKPLPFCYNVRDVLPHIELIRLGGKPDNWQDTSRPAGTVTQSDGARDSTSAYLSSYMCRDADGERKYTIGELRKLCGFPEDFRLIGNFAQQWERLGRAVPPVMMKHVAETIRDEILCRL